MLWRKSDPEEALFRAACKRVRKRNTSDLLDYAEAVVLGIDKDIQDFRKEGDLASLADIGVGLLSMQALILELKARRESELGRDFTGVDR